jgi:hypothetical protein
MSLEMAHKVILPPKKNYIPQFLKQRDINSYFLIPSRDFFQEKQSYVLTESPLCKHEGGQSLSPIYLADKVEINFNTF